MPAFRVVRIRRFFVCDGFPEFMSIITVLAPDVKKMQL